MLKKEDELKKKQKKVEEKNSKLIIKPNKKVPEIFNFTKTKRINSKTPDKKIKKKKKLILMKSMIKRKII